MKTKNLKKKRKKTKNNLQAGLNLIKITQRKGIMNKFYSLVTFSLLCPHIYAYNNMFDKMYARMEKMEQHMKEMMEEFDQETGHSQIDQSNQLPPFSIKYDDAEYVVVNLSLAEDSLKEVNAEAFEKQNTALIIIPSESGDIKLNIDKNGIQFSSEKRILKKNKDDKGESQTISYAHQNYYSSFATPVDPIKAAVKIKGNDLIITLPRENKKQKIEVTRENA